ncbi:MAG: cbb3-type cytochrome c oxidase subunit II [Acidobacteriota bacterium]|nr:cbb3-type cytochrome c oxidase subunit II [Acidobacteriota bacterium]
MWTGRLRNSGWQGASLVAITYIYFLIFAQFAFLGRLAALGIAGTNLKAVMAAMAAGGILLSLLTPRISLWSSPLLRLRLGLSMSSAAAFLALLPLSISVAIAVALLIGAGLGLLTVTLVTHLGQWCGEKNQLLKVGLGTGIGYLLCNIPAFFAASPQVQAVAAGLLCLAGIGITPRAIEVKPNSRSTDRPAALPFSFIVACFAALVWLDSAAFFIIQHTASLKAGTWQGTAHLWTNGALHLCAALGSAWLLRRRALSFVLSLAFFVLACACLLLLDPARILPASVLYPIGVSLYSVALVAYPSLISPAASIAQRGRQAGWLYAIAGWVASALGIGMGQNLGHVPPAFVAAAGAIVLLPWLLKICRMRTREIGLVAVVLLAAFLIQRIHVALHAGDPLSQVERGRRVYISEGCIHCHSQYVRPDTKDVLMWGPVESIEDLRRERPPLIGNRRQGPDLAEVGGRRSPLWLKMHFFDPAEVSGASIMPSYAFLFRDGRGNDLVEYLESLRGPGTQQHVTEEEQWRPSAAALAGVDAADGERLFRRDCATCHSSDGHTRAIWQASFKRLPPDLSAGPFFYLPPAEMPELRFERLAQITRFGIPGTDMAGHEYLTGKQTASIALWLLRNMPQAHPSQKQSIP